MQIFNPLKICSDIFRIWRNVKVEICLWQISVLFEEFEFIERPDLEEELVHKKNEYDSDLAQSENISVKENEVRDQQERINACEAHLDMMREFYKTFNVTNELDD